MSEGIAALTAAWLAAVVCVGVMGFAIQRGGTCTVAAVDELLNSRRAQRLLAMAEASLWVAGALVLARLTQLAGSMPAAFAVSAWTVAGGALLGLGAWLNQACVIGSVARLGSGQWAYALTPVGFFVGSLGLPALYRPAAAVTLATPSALFDATTLLGAAFLIFVLWRVGPALFALRGSGRAGPVWRKVWSPHGATVVIGVSFVISLLLAGRWTYTDVLADLAHAMVGRPADLLLPLLLLAALYIGALVGGATAGRWRTAPLSAPQLLRCFGGGVVMAWGSALIPGSNDGLILIGIPLLRPYAWLAFAAMFAAIVAAFLAQRAWSRRRHGGAEARSSGPRSGPY